MDTIYLEMLPKIKEICCSLTSPEDLYVQELMPYIAVSAGFVAPRITSPQAQFLKDFLSAGVFLIQSKGFLFNFGNCKHTNDFVEVLDISEEDEELSVKMVYEEFLEFSKAYIANDELCSLGSWEYMVSFLTGRTVAQPKDVACVYRQLEAVL